VELNPNTKVIDSTKLQSYMECPRKFFYEHILGWRIDAPAHALHFGTCWHSALEALWLNGFNIPDASPEQIALALEIANATFLDEYRKEFDELTDEIYFPKTPSMAAECLEDYARLMRPESQEWEVLFTEIYLTVPILNGHVVHGRMDQLCQNRGTLQKKVREYKTTGRFDRQWRDQWLLSTQIGTYTHALYSLYDVEDVHGVDVEAAVFLKKGTKVESLPCRRTPEQMLVWLTSTTGWYERLLGDLLYIESAPLENLQNDDVLPVFLLNTQSCTKYYGCAYHDYCSAWANPIQYMDEPPIGFRQEFWSPKDRPAKKVIDLTGGKDA